MANVGPIPSAAVRPMYVNDLANNPVSQRDLVNNAALSRDDAARAGAPTIAMIATSAFTIISTANDGTPASTVVNVGDEFQISAFDLPRFVGKSKQKPSP